MSKTDIENLKDLRFNITDDMRQVIINMLVIQQILEESKLSKRDRKFFEKEKGKLLEQLQCKFIIHNQKQIDIVRAYLNEK